MGCKLLRPVRSQAAQALWDFIGEFEFYKRMYRNKHNSFLKEAK